MLRIKISYDELLSILYALQLKELPGKNSHELLLQDIQAELITYLDSTVRKGFKASYTIKLASSQCRAIMSMFLNQYLPLDQRRAIHFNKILAIIDKASKQPKMIPVI
jgi:hypothetical protein